MRLTRGADYGVRGVLYLAKQPPGAVVLVGDIAAAEQLPESYLAPREGCDKMDSCSIYPVLARAQRELLSVLDSTTLGQLARDDGTTPRGDPR